MYIPAPQLRSPGTLSRSLHLSALLHSLGSDGDHILSVGTRSLLNSRQAGKKARVKLGQNRARPAHERGKVTLRHI